MNSKTKWEGKKHVGIKNPPTLEPAPGFFYNLILPQYLHHLYGLTAMGFSNWAEHARRCHGGVLKLLLLLEVCCGRLKMAGGFQDRIGLSISFLRREISTGGIIEHDGQFDFLLKVNKEQYEKHLRWTKYPLLQWCVVWTHHFTNISAWQNICCSLREIQNLLHNELHFFHLSFNWIFGWMYKRYPSRSSCSLFLAMIDLQNEARKQLTWSRTKQICLEVGEEL